MTQTQTHRAALAFAALLLVPAPVLACPKAFGDGLVIRYDDGSSVLQSATPTPRLIREDITMPSPDENFAQEAWFGIFLHRVWYDGVDAPPSEVTDYAEPPELPEPGSARQGLVASVTDEGQVLSQRIDLSAGPLSRIEIGDCAFDGYEVDLRVFEPDYMYRDRYLVLPELGTGFLIETQDSEDLLQFRPVAIMTPAEAAARGDD